MMLKRKQYLRAGKLVAAVSGTEWTQRDRFEVGLTDDPRCQLCTEYDGTLEHRMEGCPMRVQGGPQEPVRLPKYGKERRWWAVERGLVPAPDATLAMLPEPTETWYGDTNFVTGHVFVDGSGRYRERGQFTLRTGWSVVVIDKTGSIKCAGIGTMGWLGTTAARLSSWRLRKRCRRRCRLW